MGKYARKRIKLNLYGWTPSRSFGHAITIPFFKPRWSERIFPREIGWLSVGRDDDWTIGLNIVNARIRKSAPKAQLAKDKVE